MDYEKKYKETLERAKQLLRTSVAFDRFTIERVFPELKENKKEWIEKIRQELKSYLEHREVKQISESDAIQQWIAWLEKQGKQKSTGHNENEEPQVYETNDGDVVTYSETNGYKVIEPKFKVGDWISNDMCDVHIASIENGMYYFDEGDGLSIVFVDEHYHLWTIEDAKDGEVITYSETEGYKVVEPKFKIKYAGSEYNVFEIKDIAGVIFYGIEDEPNHIDYVQAENCEIIDGYGIKKNGCSFPTKSIIFSEQKSANNEPKFHEGDWVIYNNDICQIVKREEGCNILVTQFGVEKEPVNERNLSTAKLWDISDAKDSDVLSFKNNSGIIICKSPTNCDTGSYCRLIYDNLINKEESGWDSTLLVPAIKEQRDLLFQKMKENGYEWDSQKKELKKIDVELTDFEKSLEHIMIETLECGDTRNLKADAEMLLRLAQNPTKWSEEDERNIQNIDAVLFYDKTLPEETCVKLRNFLKTLKQRCI